MKKKISLITALIISLTSLNALAEIDSYTYDVFTGKMTITGKTESGKENRNISLNVYNPEKGGAASLQYADTTYTDKDGRYEFTFKLHKNGSTDFGEYKIAVGGYDYDTAEGKTIYIAGDEETAEIIEALNTKTADELSSVIKEYAKKLNINLDLFESLDEKNLAAAVSNEAKNESFDKSKLDDVYRRLKIAAVIAGSNEGRSDLLYNGTVMNYKDVLELSKLDSDGITLYSVYDTMLSEEGKAAVNNALLKKNFKDYAAFKNEFMIRTMLNTIRYPSVGGVEYVSSVITEANAKACGLSADKYLASSKKSEVNAKVARKSYDTIAALASAIIPQSDGGGKGNSSPGGKGGSSTGGNGMPVGNTTVGTNSEQNSSAAEPKMFNDIPEGYWLYKELFEMKNMEIISGDSDNNFNPDQPIKREEFAKMLCKVFNLKMQDNSVEFTDVVPGAWYEQYVKLAASNGIVTGYEDGSFGIGKNISRQDICTMVFRALKTEGEDPTQAVFKFKDTDEISEYAKDAINYMYIKEVVNGFEDYTFRPKDECTRVHAAKILHKVLNRARGAQTAAEEQ